MLKCEYCGEEKPESEFNPQSKKRCRKCLYAANMERYYTRYRAKRTDTGARDRARRSVVIPVTSELERAYAAGLIDGEGCISLYQTAFESHAVTVRVTNTSWAMIDFLHGRWGGNLSHRVANQETNKQAVWYWSLAANQALRFLDDLYPYLRVKRPQAKLARRYQRYVVTRRGDNRNPKRKALRIKFAALMKSMNTRGYRPA